MCVGDGVADGGCVVGEPVWTTTAAGSGVGVAAWWVAAWRGVWCWVGGTGAGSAGGGRSSGGASASWGAVGVLTAAWAGSCLPEL